MQRKGSSLIELILIFALSALLLPVLIDSLTSSREGKAQQIQKFAAVSTLKETMEAVKGVKERGWSSFPGNGTYHPVISQNKWTLSGGTATSDGLTIAVEISDIYRASDNTIVITGGVLDASTKKVVATVSWTTPFSSAISATTYITRYRNNAVQLDSTTIDFNEGTSSGTIVASTLGSIVPNDGEVTLGAGGHGNWCSPSDTSSTVDLPKNGVANAVWAVEGKVAAATGDNASGVSFANIVVDSSIPPVAVIEGTFDGYKTNSIFIDDDYAYIGTDNNTKEVVIIDLHQLNPVTKKYAEVGYFNTPGSNSASSVYISGQVGYVLSANKLYTFDVSSKIGSRAQLGSTTLLSNGKKVVVLGSYAYVGLLNDSIQMQVVQITNGGQLLTVVGQTSLSGEDATDIFVNSTGTRAYITTATSSSQRELFIIDITTKIGNRPLIGSYDTSGMDPRGISLTPGNRAIVVGIGGEEYQVINIANESIPVRCGGMDIASGVHGLSTLLESDGDAYSYIITGDSVSELKIIIGGPGGQYASSGEYISAPISIASSSAFNYFLASVNEPVQTSLKVQVAVNASCSDTNFTFIGPDSNNPTTSYFLPLLNSIKGQIPLQTVGSYTNLGKCFRYKIYMSTSDLTNSPVLSDVTVNYSP